MDWLYGCVGVLLVASCGSDADDAGSGGGAATSQSSGAQSSGAATASSGAAQTTAQATEPTAGTLSASTSGSTTTRGGADDTGSAGPGSSSTVGPSPEICAQDPGDNACVACVKVQCCAQLGVCEAEEPCACAWTCFQDTGNTTECMISCGAVMGGGPLPSWSDLTTCMTQGCALC